MKTRSTTVVSVLALCAMVLMAAPASAHRERETFFPEEPGEVPQYRPAVSTPFLVVCKADSADRIRALRGRVRGLNQHSRPGQRPRLLVGRAG